MFTDFQLLAIAFVILLIFCTITWMITGYDKNLKNRVVENIIKANSAEYNKMLVESIVLNSK